MKPVIDEELLKLLATANVPEDELGGLDATNVNSVFRDRFTEGRNGVEGFSVIPLWVGGEIARAHAYQAAVLISAILRRIRLREFLALRYRRISLQEAHTLPITDAVWDDAGLPADPSNKWARQAALQHLRRVPGVLKLEERHKRLTRYQVTLGDMWDER